LYYNALGHTQHAISTLQKALFIDPDDVSATVHLARLYLTPPPPSAAASPTTTTTESSTNTSTEPSPATANRPSQSDIDLACGLLTASSRGRGWDVPEVWYYLGTAYRLQGRAVKEGEALERALRLSEGRGVREVGAAVGVYI
jgi:tetratricopeptide (TPR) repeat protein